MKRIELDIERLRKENSKLPEIMPFSENPGFAAQVAALGIFREAGTINDELARFLYDCGTGDVIPRESIRAELVEMSGLTGVRIWSEVSARLEVRARGMRDLLFPAHSFNADGTIEQLLIFPELVARILESQGVQAVVVRSWAMNSIFGGFDPSKEYYQTNFWEIENNDTLLFAKLVAEGKLALLGTHDLIAHAAGVRADAWLGLKQSAARVRLTIETYFASVRQPSIASLILPYTIGVILDDLAQPPTYDSPAHLAMLDALLEELDRRTIPADLPTYIREFPGAFQGVIELSRTPGIEREPERIRKETRGLADEIRRHSLLRAG